MGADDFKKNDISAIKATRHEHARNLVAQQSRFLISFVKGTFVRLCDYVRESYL